MDPHLFFDILSLVGIFAASWAGVAINGLLSDIKVTLATVKAELVANQTEIKEDLTEKHSENVKNLAVHQARDEEMFRTVNMTLSRIEAKVGNGRV